MSIDDKMKIVELLAKSGMKVNNLIVEHNGDNYFYEGKDREEKHKVTDEQVSKAIISINGDDKPLNEKQLFIGVISVLLSKYGWTGKWAACCTRINNLPEKDHFVKSCDYNSIKILTALKFASIDYKDWATYQPSKSETTIFRKCKAVADAFDEAISMQYPAFGM